MFVHNFGKNELPIETEETNKRSGSHAGNRYKCDCCEIMSFCHVQWKRCSVVMQKLVSGESTSGGAAHLGPWMIR
jgi:hypothetical protein